MRLIKAGGDIGGEGGACCWIEFARPPMDAKARAVVKAGDDVEVDVEHGLVRELAVVLKEVVRRGLGGGEDSTADAGEGEPYRRRVFVGELVDGDGGGLGDDEGVPAREGEDVEEREDSVILVDLVAGDLAAEDFRKDRECHGEWYGESGGVRGAGGRVGLGASATMALWRWM